MGYFKTEDGHWKKSNIATLLILLVALLVVAGVATSYEPPPKEERPIEVYAPVNNYYTIDGVSSPLNTMGCHLLDLNSGEGSVLVCRK